MSQPATKRRKLNNQQPSDEEYAFNDSDYPQPTAVRARIKSRKRGFFQKPRACKANEIDLSNTNTIMSDEFDEIPLEPVPNLIECTPEPPVYVEQKSNAVRQRRRSRSHSHSHSQTHTNGHGHNHNALDGINGLDDKAKMARICDDLQIAKGVHTGVRLYGFTNHLAVYEEILRLTQMNDRGERDMIVQQFNSNKLRDIKSKIQSEGKTGKKDQMISGICKKLVEYKKNYLPIQNEIMPEIEWDNGNGSEIALPMPVGMEDNGNVSLVNRVQTYTGSDGQKCDGCMRDRNEYICNKYGQNEDEDISDVFLVQICPVCKYGVCSECSMDTENGTCFCKNGNFGSEYNSDIAQREYYQRGYVTVEERRQAEQMMTL